MSERNNWVCVSKDTPCPACGKPDWCRLSADGRLAACRRVADGCWKQKADKNGAPVYLHRLDGANGQAARNSHGPPPAPAANGDPAKAADADTLHAVYAALLKTLPLSATHRDNLRRRGLSDEEIDRREYRTLPARNRTPRAVALHRQFGNKLLSVPGFAVRERDGRPYLTIAGPAGLLVPVRDVAGRVVALKVRRDTAADGENRYCYVSSKKDGGPGPGAPAHVSLGVQAPAETVRVTEGELKSDVTYALSGVPTLSVPGAANWRPVLPVLRGLGTRTVLLAYDADWREKGPVARGLLACGQALVEAGFDVQVERWSRQTKGIDDLLAAGQAPNAFPWDQVVEDICLVVAEEEVGQAEQEAAAKEKEKRQCKATRIVLYALEELDLFHSPEGDGYATTRGSPRQTWPLRSKAGRQYLDRLFFLRESAAAGSEAIQAAVNTLEGKARFDGPEQAVSCRTAEAGGVLYLDLGDRDWRGVAVRPGGWEVVPEHAVRFRRSRGLLALPEPARGGTVNELRNFVNVGTDAEFRLLVGWLLGALRPRGPYPVLCLHGEQGSAKSTTARVIRALIDPNSSPLRSEPRDGRDLIIAATNSWVLAFDNLSSIPPWLSDALCRLATGGGFSTRELYTDADEVLFDAMRPCLLTGIEELASRGDLLERSLILHLPAIPEEDRRTEAEFRAAFEEARPRILGALLDTVAAGLRNLPGVRLPRLPRMADFAAWVTACEPFLGWAPGTFLRDYAANGADASELALEASPVTAPLWQFLGQRGTWEGTASALLDELKKLAAEDVVKARDWPKKPHVLSGKLRRLAPDLRKAGVGVEFDRQPGGKRTKIIRLADKARPEASRASEASQTVTRAEETTVTPGRSADPMGRPEDAPPEVAGAPRDAQDARDAPAEDSSGPVVEAEGEGREVFEL